MNNIGHFFITRHLKINLMSQHRYKSTITIIINV